MRKIMIVMLVTATTAVYAQLDHVKGAQGAEVSGGIGDRTALFKVGYYYVFSQRFFIKTNYIQVLTRPGVTQGYALSRYGLDVAQAYNVYSYRGKLFFNVFLGITTAWNTAQVDKGDFKYEDTMKFGFLGGGELEVRIYKKLMGVLTGDGRYMLGDAFGHWRAYGTLGLRYSF